ncbi:MAG TPA: PPK2 family polyphosphate kinase [Pilimelia sp.]|nr:PPK2 family polyphosphate kinase [Pilimelia sp.]
MRARLAAPPGPVELAAIDPRGTPGVPPDIPKEQVKDWSRAEVTRVGADLARLQETLYAAEKGGQGSGRRLLLVLQAMDCGGKDGTIKHVAGAMNPLGLRVVAFGPPTAEEREHDFLWRIRRGVPEPGIVGVFNRSHYEDVLIARVESLVPPPVWEARYDEINAFERELADDGVALVKVFLHISYAEQHQRLLDRLDDPTKRWKYNPADIDARARWGDYHEAYEAALGRCSTEHAPWFVVPADRKWYRNWAVAHLVRETLDGMRLAYPEPD